MVTSLVEGLRRAISPERLEAYRPTTASDDIDMLATYLWNIELCECLYSPLHALEITLRNAISDAMAEKYNGDAYWFMDLNRLSRRQANIIRDIANRLPAQSPPGKYIAETNFSFWTEFLSTEFYMKLWIPNRGAMLHAVFPYAPKSAREPKSLGLAYRECRLLRNRVFHYEPIWRDSLLSHKYRQIMELIRWSSPEMQETVALLSRFPGTLASGSSDVRARVIGAFSPQGSD